MNPRRSPKMPLNGSSLAPLPRGLCCGLSHGGMELGKAQRIALAMTHHHQFDGEDWSRHYSRWPDPWRSEDEWGPITAAVIFLIILAGLIVYGSGVHL
jgi:hypothetical protein